MSGAHKHVFKTLTLCVLFAVANCLLNILVNRMLALPLFLDTLFTISITFLAGPVFGIICAVLTSVAGTFLMPPYMPIYCMYALCSIAGVALTEVFCRSYNLGFSAKRNAAGWANGDTDFSTFTILLLLSVVMCLQMSVMGGLIASIISVLISIPEYAVSPESYFKLGLLMNHIPSPAAEIIARIPINIFDRILSVFGGYGLALLVQGALAPVPGAQRQG
jgi:hypothetical protein